MTASGNSNHGTPGMRLTLRDMELLQALHTARYLTTPQIEKLFWRGSLSELGVQVVYASGDDTTLREAIDRGIPPIIFVDTGDLVNLHT